MIRITVPILMVLTEIAFAQTIKEQAGISPWGPEDEIGILNLMSEKPPSSFIRESLNCKGAFLS